MHSITIKTKSGNLIDSFFWGEGDLLLGRSKECNVILHGWRVDKVHAKIEFGAEAINLMAIENNKVILNERKISSIEPLRAGDRIEIGDYVITLGVGSGAAQIKEPTPKPESAISAQKNLSDSVVEVTESKQDLIIEDDIANIVHFKKLSETCRAVVHRQLLTMMDLRRVNVASMSDKELRDFTSTNINEILSNFADFPHELDKATIAKQVLAEAVGLGPLEDLINDESVSEIMVNSHDEIFFEKSGRLLKSDVTFTDAKAVLSAIERIVAPLGRRIDESSPMVDGRLKDGSRVNAIIPPLALKGPCITIRKFMKNRLRSEDLVKFGSISAEMVKFLNTAIVRKQNLVISGGTGSGKTTLLNVLSNFIPADERIVTVEDAAELRLYQPNLVSLESRPINQEGKGEVSIRELVKNCLRMRPDRIVVGECRGGEALDMLQAMNTGHDGSLTTIHANSPRDCISRIEVLVLMSGMDLPVRAIREQISSAVDIIVQQTRFACGSRKVTSVAEVTGIEGDVVQIAEIFKFKQTGFDAAGKVQGEFYATGVVPEFYEGLRARGIEVDMSIFNIGDF